MSILQLSRISHRKGHIENLPQLTGAELGWALDERRLFIGNGDPADGAPIVGNTEILTEHSDLLAFTGNYIYKGEHAGYVVNDTVPRSMQSKLDEYVSVKDFGAKGNGVDDDTNAINNALYELFCRAVNPEIRRSLYFPAGRYKITAVLNIPPYAKVYGDGIDSSVIAYMKDGAVIPHVIQVSDSDNNTGVNIGTGGAIPPTGISISDMSIVSNEKNTVLLLDNITNSSFQRVHFKASSVPADLGNVGAAPNSAIKIQSSNSLLRISSNISFNQCITHGTTFGLDINESSAKNIRFENGKLGLHFIGVSIGAALPASGEITGINITRTIFDNIATQGILIENSQLNSSAFNVFYNVGNGFGTTPQTPILDIHDGNNISIGDLFERNASDNIVQPRIKLNGKPSIAYDSAHAIHLGEYERRIGLISELPNDTSGNIFKFNSVQCGSFKVDYTISREKGTFNEVANGTMTIVNKYDPLDPVNPVASAIAFNDEYTESGNTGIVLDIVQDGFNVDLNYVSANLGGNPTIFKYSIERLD